MIFEYVQSLFSRFDYKTGFLKSRILSILDFIEHWKVERKIFKITDDYEALIEFSNILETLDSYYGSGNPYLAQLLNPYVLGHMRSARVIGQPTSHMLRIYCFDEKYEYTVQFNYSTANACDVSKDINYTITIKTTETDNSIERVINSANIDTRDATYIRLAGMVLRVVLLGVVDIVRKQVKQEVNDDQFS